MEKPGQGRSRLYVDVPADIRRRVRVAAAHEDVTVQEYVVKSLERSLSDREALEEADACDDAQRLLDRLRATRDRVFRGGMLSDDSVDIIRASREKNAQ